MDIKKIGILLITMFLAFCVGLFYISYNKLLLLEDLNKMEDLKNQKILQENNLENLIGTNYEDIIIKNNKTLLNKYEEIEKKEIENECKKSMEEKYNLVYVSYTDEYIKYNYYKFLLNNYKDKLNYKALYFLYKELGFYGYQTPLFKAVRKTDNLDFVSYKILIKSSGAKFSYKKKGFPILEEIPSEKYFSYIKEYDLRDIVLNNKRIKISNVLVFKTLNKKLFEKRMNDLFYNKELITIEIINNNLSKIKKTIRSKFEIIRSISKENDIDICKNINKNYNRNYYNNKIIKIINNK